tara:strand:- start:38 stop:274 length:237 start_codon:yes stop_codon:yes gene_type:complete
LDYREVQEFDYEVLNAQLKAIFEMLQILIANMEIRDGSNALGYDFSYAEVLFQNETPTARYQAYRDKVDANFKADYPK